MDKIEMSIGQDFDHEYDVDYIQDQINQSWQVIKQHFREEDIFLVIKNNKICVVGEHSDVQSKVNKK